MERTQLNRHTTNPLAWTTALKEIADKYNYYYVPCIFCGSEKLYECSPADNYSEIKRQFESALKAAAGQ